MKKAGLAIVTYKDNFGSVLQSYATQEVVRSLGYETAIFDISGLSRDINRKKIQFFARHVFQADERHYLLDMLNSALRKKSVAKFGGYAENMKMRHVQYQEFQKKFLFFFPRVRSWVELKEQSGNCDCVLVGSDQLWRPSNIAGGYFTLEFVPDVVKKAAYATSFGLSDLPRHQYKDARAFLRRIHNISVREESGRRMVKRLTGRDVPVVCDPTMLLTMEEWHFIQREQPLAEGAYILCYFLGDNLKHRQFALRLKAVTRCRIIALVHGATYIASDDVFGDERPYDVGPGDFINLIRNAAYVCTDSFHGTVFSILNRRHFFTFRRYQDGSDFSTNDRLYTLLAWTGLSERLISGSEDPAEAAGWEIDFDAVHEKIDQKRRESLMFLRNAMGICEGDGDAKSG